MNKFPTKEITISDDPLCDKCKELGYCREKMVIEQISQASSYISEELPKVEMLNELLNLVPLRAYEGRFGDYTKKHLQTAFIKIGIEVFVFNGKFTIKVCRQPFGGNLYRVPYLFDGKEAPLLLTVRPQYPIWGLIARHIYCIVFI